METTAAQIVQLRVVRTVMENQMQINIHLQYHYEMTPLPHRRFR